MSLERVVALVDMDCFYVQVEQRLNPSLLGKPCAVVQYNEWKGGGIIAVSYEARKFGVTRQMRGDEAKEKCPEIILARVPEMRGKADLTRYRDACAEVMDVLQGFADVCERASVDEAYLDLTELVKKKLEMISLEELVDKTLACSHVIGYTDTTDSSDIRGRWMAALSDDKIKNLAMGAIIIQEARDAVKEKVGFTCSAGIAHNKVLAKIAGGSHKPNQQTLLPQHSVAKFFETIPIKKVRFFGGKFGQSVITSLGVEYMSELTRYSQEELQHHFGEKSGTWLYDVCRGREYEIVRQRQLSKSCGCGKNFTGKSRLVSKEKVRYWMYQLASELSDRLRIEEEKNNRKAKLVSVGLWTETKSSRVRSFPLRYSDPESICENAMQVIKTFNSGTADKWQPGVTSLSLNASKFEDISKSSGASSIVSFFAKKEKNDEEETDSAENEAPSNTCTLSTDNLESTDFISYERDEIDHDIVNELPKEIRNEIQQFLGTSKTSERSKRTSSGIEKYTIPRNTISTDQTKITKTNASETGIYDGKYGGVQLITENPTSDSESSHNSEFICCSKCSMKIEKSKMDEHQDYHFALELQKGNEILVDHLQNREPPKKRQKGTISSFFVPKGR
ncbi:DNA polymerase eta-like [Dendronephthya gigantea]|uniref:DNA polymerase eta-like n=1 Tax=Dendronephthya gigantea TaxID=151771 RepID=UPI00106B1C92|nr:DNA polymerase eta-like [Dendronephthya gigantea]